MMLSFWIATGTFSILALIAGIILTFASKRFQVNEEPLIEQVDRLLPQSQCGQCGWPGCRPYAQAICQQGEKINKCTPGGERVMLRLAEILGVEPQALEDNSPAYPLPEVAFIDEGNCIGCIKCSQACPVDAIVGTLHTLHTVISDYCTGCGLCIAPCPMNCISLLPRPDSMQGAAGHFIAIKDITLSHNTLAVRK